MSLAWTSNGPQARGRELAGTIAVSTICFMADLGGVKLTVEREDGSPLVVSMPAERRMEMLDFPRQVVEQTGERAVDIWQMQLRDYGEKEVGALAKQLADAKVDLLTVPIDIGNIASPVGERRAGYLREIEWWIDAAAQLRAPFARISTGASSGAANFDRTAQLASLGHLADYARSAGVMLLIENHSGDALDPAWIISTLEEVGRDRLGLVLDTGSFEPMITAASCRMRGKPMDEGQLDFEPIYATIAQLAPYAAVAQAKVHDVSEDGVFGPLDPRRSLAIMQKAGFSGPVVIEYEGDSVDRWEQIRRSVAAVRDVFGAPTSAA